MSHIVPLLTRMRGRLGMYLGSTSLTKLSAYLRGFDQAFQECTNCDSDPILHEFRDWIHRRFRTTTTSWEDTISANCTDEADAVESFWELFDEFLAVKVRVNPSLTAQHTISAAGNRHTSIQSGELAEPV